MRILAQIEVWISVVLSALLRAVVMLYRYVISPFTPGSCRFHPSCSAYALDAIKIHGPFRGCGLAFRRILRCNPWGPFGEDPVPPRKVGGVGTADAPECCQNRM